MLATWKKNENENEPINNTIKYNQGWQQNLWAQVQNENMGSLTQKLSTSDGNSQIMKPILAPF